MAAPLELYAVHEWNSLRFKVLGKIRQTSITKTLAAGFDHYFVVDVDNHRYPCTLRQLVDLGLPIVGPMLRHEDPKGLYADYHHEVDANGCFADNEPHYWLLHQRVRGINEVKASDCTYLVRRDAIPALRHDDRKWCHEHVIFSESARTANIPQYLDNRLVYGYLTFSKDSACCEALNRAEVQGARAELVAAPSP